MSVRVKPIASGLAIVLNRANRKSSVKGRRRAHNGGTPRRLETGDVLKVMAPNETTTAGAA
jgi:hypothetical protein